MGNFLVLNLFLALLLNSFSCEELKSRKQVRVTLHLLLSTISPSVRQLLDTQRPRLPLHSFDGNSSSTAPHL